MLMIKYSLSGALAMIELEPKMKFFFGFKGGGLQ